MVDIEKFKKEFLLYWLRGTTCGYQAHKSIEWISPDNKFALAKHKGHSTYCGRALGIRYCETMYELHRTGDDVVALQIVYHEGPNCLRSWKGRWSKKRQAEMEEFIKGISNDQN